MFGGRNRGYGVKLAHPGAYKLGGGVGQFGDHGLVAAVLQPVEQFADLRPGSVELCASILVVAEEDASGGVKIKRMPAAPAPWDLSWVDPCQLVPRSISTLYTSGDAGQRLLRFARNDESRVVACGLRQSAVRLQPREDAERSGENAGDMPPAEDGGTGSEDRAWRVCTRRTLWEMGA